MMRTVVPLLLPLLFVDGVTAGVQRFNVKALYGDITPDAIAATLKRAHAAREKADADDEVRVELDAGTWDVTSVSQSAPGLFDVSTPKGAAVPSVWLVIGGAGMNETVLTTGGHVDDIYARPVQRVRFEHLTFERVNVTTTQGTVVSTDAESITLQIEEGYPTPLEVYNAQSDQGRFIRRFKKDATTGYCSLVVDGNGHWPPHTNQQLAWHNPTQPNMTHPRNWRLELQHDLKPLSQYAPGDLVGVKSKHEAQSYVMLGGQYVEFISVRFLGHSRGVIRGGISNIRFDSCVVTKRTPGQCLSTDGGGPQLGQPNDPLIHNISVVNHTSYGTGDDSIAFFHVSGGEVRNSYLADSFARGIFLDRSDNITVEGNTLVRCVVFHDDDQMNLS